MQKEFFEQWSNASKSFVKPFENFSSLMNKVVEKTFKQNLDIFNEVVNANVTHIQKLAESKKVEDLINIQAQSAKENGAKAIKYAQSSFQTSLDTYGEFSRWFEELLGSFSSNLDKKGTTASTKV